MRNPLRGVVSKLRPADPAQVRIAALRRFATVITILTIAGHAYLGFEQSIAQPVVTVLICYVTDLFLETVVAARDGRRAGYRAESQAAPIRERILALVNFLLPAHITGLALGMLLFIGNRLDLFIVAGIIAISSKYVFRFRASRGGKHYFNPSNFGITVVLLFYSDTVSIAPPYQFTENLGSRGSIALPAVLACLGLFFNAVFTGRVPLIAAWIGGFALQAVVRSIFETDISLWAALSPLTGMALLLFTMYMVTDPGTTPRSTRGQVVFGLAVAAVYGVLVAAHIAFGIFFALTIVCACRGLALTVLNARDARRSPVARSEPRPVTALAAYPSGEPQLEHTIPRAKEPTGT